MGMISHLRLRQFRNYRELDAEFRPGVNLLVGGNGQGKSTILEAIYYLGVLRSFRTHRIASLRQWHEDAFFVGGEFSGQGEKLPFSLGVSYGERRVLKVNGNPVSRASEFINHFLCVPFVPEDLDLVKGTAAGRRRFLDIMMSQLDPAYLVQLQCYHDALRGRNAMLRETGRYAGAAVAGYDRLLAAHGAQILSRREEVVTRFDQLLQSSSEILLRGGGGRFCTRHVPGIPAAILRQDKEESGSKSLQEALRELWHTTLEQDRREGSTRLGPHRGDMNMLLDGKPLALYGSEGECRLASLAMRLASVEMLTSEATTRKEEVTLLVDDVMGELDPQRRMAFLDAISGAVQVCITSTELLPWMEARAAAILEVEQGAVHKR